MADNNTTPNTPEISIIMPCFNAEAHVARGVASVLGQTFRHLELIAVDDGSTDGTAAVLAAIGDPRVRVISQPNRGVSAARNRGLREARGAFVAFLDADDTWRPDCLELLLAALGKAPEAVAAYCGWQNVGLDGGRGEPYLPPDYEAEGKLEHFLRCCPWPIHGALVRRGALTGAGGFPEGLTHAEDYSLWLRVAAFRPVVRVPEVLAFYHFHGMGQASTNRLKAAFGDLEVKLDFLKRFPDAGRALGRDAVRRLVYGRLLSEGFSCYWARDLVAARGIFRVLMRAGYGSLRDWRYYLPALLPLGLHRELIRRLEQSEGANR